VHRHRDVLALTALRWTWISAAMIRRHPRRVGQDVSMAVHEAAIENPSRTLMYWVMRRCRCGA